MNPVDTKVRRSAAPEPGQTKVLGWDAVGEIVAIGPDVTGFRPGEQVYYAGSITRSGANAEERLRRAHHRPQAYQPVRRRSRRPAPDRDHRLGGAVRPARCPPPGPGAANAVLVIGGAGGVGSITIQLLQALTDLTVIATASRPETEAWVRELGAHHVIDHRKPLAEQVAALGIGAPAFVFSTTETETHLTEIAALDCGSGPPCADRRPEGTHRHLALQAQVGVDPLGDDVHPLDLRHSGHAGAGAHSGCRGKAC